MLAELDGEAVERAGVQAGQEALDDELGAQVEPGDLADDLGPQVFLGSAHWHHRPVVPRWHQQVAVGGEEALAIDLVDAGRRPRQEAGSTPGTSSSTRCCPSSVDADIRRT